MFIPSLFLGGALGTVITLILGMSIPAVIVGAFVGACIAWVAFDIKQIVREVPRAFHLAVNVVRQIASTLHVGWTGDVLKFALRPRLLLYALVSIGVAEYHVRWWEWEGYARLIGGLHFALFLMMVYVPSGAYNTKGSSGNTGWIMHRIGVPNYDMIGRMLGEHLVLGAEWTRRDLWRQMRETLTVCATPFIVCLEVMGYISIVVTVIAVVFTLAVPVAVVVAIAFLCIVAWKLFVLVHSEKRRMVFVDSGLGVLVGYAVLRWQFGTALPPLAQLAFVLLGGACAVVLGVVNYEIIARRALKLNPV